MLDAAEAKPSKFGGLQGLFGKSKRCPIDELDQAQAEAKLRSGPRTAVRRKPRSEVGTAPAPLELTEPVEAPPVEREAKSRRTVRRPGAKGDHTPRRPARQVAKTPRPAAEDVAPVAGDAAQPKTADEIQALMEAIQRETPPPPPPPAAAKPKAPAAPKAAAPAKRYRLRPVFNGKTQSLYTQLFDALEMHYPTLSLHAGLAPAAIAQLGEEDYDGLAETKIDFVIVDAGGLPIVALTSQMNDALAKVLKGTGLPTLNLKKAKDFDSLWSRLSQVLSDD